MRNRAITTQELHSSTLANVSILANLLYHHLKVMADDFGTIKASNIDYIKNICFPMRNDISNSHLQDAVKELSKQGLILEICYLRDNYFFLPSFVIEQKINNPSLKRNITKDELTKIIIDKAKSLGELAPEPIQKLIHYYCQDEEVTTRKGTTKEVFFSDSLNREEILSEFKPDKAVKPRQATPKKEEKKEEKKETPNQKPQNQNELPKYIQDARGQIAKGLAEQKEQETENNKRFPFTEKQIIAAIFCKERQYTVTQFLKTYTKELNYEVDNLISYIKNQSIKSFMENRILEDYDFCKKHSTPFLQTNSQGEKQCLFNSKKHIFNAFKFWFEREGCKLIPKR